jgi:hypothetical protein
MTVKHRYVVSRLVLNLSVGYALFLGASATAQTTPSQDPAQDGASQAAP